MPNAYSVEIHSYLTKKIQEAEEAIAQKDPRSAYYQGQLEEFNWIRSYLRKNIDLKNFIYY
ncbi:MAG: hypothetical protein P4L42_00385 [Desulfocapsaceae bacterium]|nr:hypothetical protein [Desulfocapsaceae bacterium]